ncbi:MAG: hypothetical protein KDA84_24135, partial [Planctomycetaceae bacterium]|nr:hypothetical protein [Planctomycetaceae bacterium]
GVITTYEYEVTPQGRETVIPVPVSVCESCRDLYCPKISISFVLNLLCLLSLAGAIYCFFLLNWVAFFASLGFAVCLRFLGIFLDKRANRWMKRSLGQIEIYHKVFERYPDTIIRLLKSGWQVSAANWVSQLAATGLFLFVVFLGPGVAFYLLTRGNEPAAPKLPPERPAAVIQPLQPNDSHPQFSLSNLKIAKDGESFEVDWTMESELVPLARDSVLYIVVRPAKQSSMMSLVEDLFWLETGQKNGTLYAEIRQFQFNAITNDVLSDGCEVYLALADFKERHYKVSNSVTYGDVVPTQPLAKP